MTKKKLAEYNKKRDFAVTGEPKGRARRGRKKGLEFVVQKHGARRLHYDFRLELDGVMKSWAVTRGPSFDPSDKRLAVRTEDHPVAYNRFEGVIPAKQHGAGPVMIWDSGAWVPQGNPGQGMKKGHLAFDLKGKRMQGRWHLVRMKQRKKESHENWLLIKGDDAHALRGRKGKGILKKASTSIVSGRTLDEIRKGNGKKRVKDKFIVEGVTITHPDREVYPGTGITKGDVAQYYARAMKYILPFVEGRFISLLRCTETVEGECFFQRAPMQGLGPEVMGKTVTHEGKKHDFLYIDSPEGLFQLVQMGVIEFHAWQSRVDNLGKPDQMVFDLDPAEDVPFDAVKLAAQDVRQRLQDIGLASFPRITGGKGIHIAIPLKPQHGWGKIKTFARGFALQMEKDAPKVYVATMSKKKRKGKIFVDYLRNGYSSTAIAPFSLRARKGAPVAVPLTWQELEKIKSASAFSISDAVRKTTAATKRQISAFFAHPQELRPGT